MGPQKDEGSNWGYEEQGNGQLHSVQSFHNLPPTSQQPQNAKLSHAPRKHSITKILKNGSVQSQGESSPSTKMAKCSETHARKLQQARQQLIASGCKLFSLWQEHLQTTSFSSGLREHRCCCSCEPSCIGGDQRSAIVQVFNFSYSLLLRFSEYQISALCQVWT